MLPSSHAIVALLPTLEMCEEVGFVSLEEGVGELPELGEFRAVGLGLLRVGDFMEAVPGGQSKSDVTSD
jgi:hypothetical protein